MSNFPGYPITRYHPVFGARTANDPNEAAALTLENDWFDSAARADFARTDREAGMTVLQNQRLKLAAARDGTGPASGEPVRNSVQAQESLDAGLAEPL